MTLSTIKANIHRYWHIILTPMLGILFFYIAIRIVDPVKYPNNDFFTFWLGGHLSALGQNPYLTDIWIGGHHEFGASWIPNTTFIYPLPLALFFVPLGLIPLYQAYVVWVLLTQYMITLSVALLLSFYPARLKKSYILPITAGVILFRPTLLTLINGQLSGFLLFVIVCIIWLWERGRWREGAVLLPILALKPNLGVPLILLLSFYLILELRITSLITGVISGLCLLATGFVQNFQWISEFWMAGNTKLSQTFGYSPTIWGLSALICDHKLNCSIGYGSVVGLFILIGFVGLLVNKQRSASPALVVGLAITVMLLLTPYTWPYDQILLIIPIITVMMNLASRRNRFALISSIFLVLDIAAIGLLKISAEVELEIWNVMIPLAVLALVCWYLVKGDKDL